MTYDVEVFGDIELSRKERLTLGMHPKFSVIQQLPKDALDLEKEIVAHH